ncbi:glycosyltransferase [Leptolyngbya boryana CZ1]|uniref:Glycosyltransferase n=1 Tax=Leptolyngbya boryana CZ1 TaxID=3060204 RepID=A0AA96WR78_LEPBY|nr:glycosyltransferase [Leptolyngbya boryana]WNZ44008.1 glycosyltransferase [Leptolyngbya boryana CZ1]
MRILFVAPYIGQGFGGPGKVVTELATALGAQNIELDLITTDANATSTLDVPLKTWIHRDHYRIQFFPSWHHHDLIWSPALLKMLERQHHQYDLVHTHCMFMPLLSMAHRLCDRCKIPYVMTPHGMLDSWALAYKAKKKYIYYTAFEKAALRRASAIHTLTSIEAQQVNALGFQQTIVIPNGIHRQEFDHPGDPRLFYQHFPQTQFKRLILFLGRIDPKKGLDLLAPAFAQVRHHFPDAHLIVAGPDNIGFLPTAQNYFEQAGCGTAVTFTHMLTGALKQAALAAAEVFVLPSYSEGFSMSILEAMATGLPCVITKQCNFPEASNFRFATVVDAAAETLSEALLMQLRDRATAAQMGERARQYILQHYTWNQIATTLGHHYQKIVQQSKAPTLEPSNV